MIELYQLREKGFGWADITVNANNQSGRIQIASDFGDWQYYWSHCGEPFKQFLVGLDKHYTAGKFKANRHFDLENNVRALQHELYEQLMEENITQPAHDTATEELKEIAETCSSNIHEFWSQLSQTKVLYHEIGGSDWETTNSIEPGFERFWQEVWPVFTEQLKKELTIITA